MFYFDSSFLAFMFHLPVLNVVRADGLSSLDRFSKVRIDGRPRDGFQALQLTRGGHVESLYKVVQDSDGDDDCHEDGRSDTDYH